MLWLVLRRFDRLGSVKLMVLTRNRAMRNAAKKLNLAPCQHKWGRSAFRNCVMVHRVSWLECRNSHETLSS
jgi:hypothetical protein